MDHIRRVIRPDSEIWTDELRSYRLLRILGGRPHLFIKQLTIVAFFKIEQQGSVLIKSKGSEEDEKFYHEVGCHELSLFAVVLDQLGALLRLS
ncbi:hypothetical protein Zmor_006576 [Zophobas morio]|uniref:Uncharacterized protein n=1 Tax=Zophobas morio TaxID=2755281 RepID=A0AA38IRT3_9CUCU|nr:hypothetical protein Zmor_006576 [Zophobas morio]